jgi:hypothetical protein
MGINENTCSRISLGREAIEQLVGAGKGRDFMDIERRAFEEQWTRTEADTRDRRSWFVVGN